MFAFALVTAAQEAEQARELPIPAWAFGALALLAFFVLFGITWSFRGISAKSGPAARQGTGTNH